MSSMTDIIFLLLIFFMLTSTAISPNALNLVLPSSERQAPATPPRVAVSIDENLNYYVGTQKVNIDDIGAILRAEIDAAGPVDPKEATVILNAEKTVPIEYVVKVMDIAYQMKIKMILATKPSK